jgi:hypothetical protein
MSLQFSHTSISETDPSWDDPHDTQRISLRVSLVLLIAASAVGYALVYEMASLAWGITVGW